VTTPTIPDTMVAPLLLVLRDELRRQLLSTMAGRTLRCAVVHSATQPVMDGCVCERDVTHGAAQGDAWVRLGSLNPAVFGNSFTTTTVPSTCPTVWQASIELGTYRCVPVPDEGQALPEEVVTNTALMLASDMAALLRTLSCCEELQELQVAAEGYSPIGPAGGCAGGALTFTVDLPYQAPRC
jgi:hypothetical protein